MTIIIFFAVLFVLILVHEWGHFIVAKKNGIRVDEFGIGFPPKLFGIKKGETEYTLNLFPIGGFVKIFGEDGASAPSSPVESEANDRRSEASAEAGEGGGASAPSSPVSSIDEKPDAKLNAEPGLGGAKSSIDDYSRSFVAKPKRCKPQF